MFYQIYPRSFSDSDGDGIGDLKGIISRLDHLNDNTSDSLGVDALWLSPFYPSPMKDFGYDITDHKDVDRTFGSMDDFKELIRQSHRRDIKVIIDLVINHTSNKHPWFLESRKSRKSPKRDWYIWHPGKGGKPPNNWLAQFELGSAWHWDERTKEYYLGTFTRAQPEVNWRNPDLKAAMFDVVRFWMGLGIDGYRMDVVNWYVKDDKLRNNPWCLNIVPDLGQTHIYDRNRPETHDICKEIRAIVDEYGGGALVGEVFTADPKEAAKYLGPDKKELHMAFNFAFLHNKWGARRFYDAICAWYSSLPKGAWPSFTLSNHDVQRHFFRYRFGKWTEARAKVAAAMLLTLRGTPFLYYGEEIGMDNGNIRKKDLKDPLGLRTWPLTSFGRDPARTPMQWDDGPNAGFTKGTPWLPVNKDYKTKNVRSQARDPSSILSFYKKLIWLRKDNPELSIGGIGFLLKGHESVIAYKRTFRRREVIVALNFKERKVGISLPLKGTKHVLLSTHRRPGTAVDPADLVLSPLEALILG